MGPANASNKQDKPPHLSQRLNQQTRMESRIRSRLQVANKTRPALKRLESHNSLEKRKTPIRRKMLTL